MKRICSKFLSLHAILNHLLLDDHWMPTYKLYVVGNVDTLFNEPGFKIRNLALRYVFCVADVIHAFWLSQFTQGDEIVEKHGISMSRKPGIL